MPPLFKTKQRKLTDFFKTISEDDIQEYCESGIYHRGYEYFEYGHISDVFYNLEKTRLKASVKGKSDYTVNIEIQDGHLEGSCTCPYGGTCKHVIATLLYAVDNNSEIEELPDAENPGADTNKYLQSLSKNDLIDLVKRFAPEQFWAEVNNKFLNKSVAHNVFKKVEKNIQKIIKECYYYESPIDFSTALDKEIYKLSGLGRNMKGEIEGLLWFIINEVGNAMDEGYLYDDYNDDYYEPSEQFIEFVTKFVTSLNFEEKTDFLMQLDTILNEQTYATFSNLMLISKTVFTEEDLPSLNNLLTDGNKKLSHSLIENYYDQVRGLLKDQDKETILKELQNGNSKWIVELALLYDSRNQTVKAIDAIKAWLQVNNSLDAEEVYKLYLDLLSKAGFDLTEAAKGAIIHCPTCSMLQKIESLVREGMSVYELILEKKNTGQLLDYLEFSDRLPEAMLLIKRSDNIWYTRLFGFFKKHKQNFRPEAVTFFSEAINKNLEFADDSHYHLVADNLQQLKQVDSSLAAKNLEDIRLNYKRRRNLMALLSKL